MFEKILTCIIECNVNVVFLLLLELGAICIIFSYFHLTNFQKSTKLIPRSSTEEEKKLTTLESYHKQSAQWGGLSARSEGKSLQSRCSRNTSPRNWSKGKKNQRAHLFHSTMLSLEDKPSPGSGWHLSGPIAWALVST